MKKQLLALVLVFILTLTTVVPTVAAEESGEEASKEKLLKEEQLFRDYVEKISKSKGISVQVVEMLVDKGYILDEINVMSEKEIALILKDNPIFVDLKGLTVAARYTISTKASAPSGYKKVSNVPYGGGTDEWFHPDSGTDSNTVLTHATKSRTLARKIFNTTATYPTIRFSYYMFGEWGEDLGRENWCHEGVDVRDTSDTYADVYSLVEGEVTYSSASKGIVMIYSPGLGKTVCYQHLSDVDGLNTLLEGEQVSVGQYLGHQNASDNHVHYQVSNIYMDTTVHSGRNLTLVCVSPLDMYE